VCACAREELADSAGKGKDDRVEREAKKGRRLNAIRGIHIAIACLSINYDTFHIWKGGICVHDFMDETFSTPCLASIS
jgi:hypothetical protein